MWLIPLVLVLLFSIRSIFQSVLRWRLYLYGKNAKRSDGLYEYTFALQNGEDIPLVVPFELSIVLDQIGGRFSGDPNIYLGPPHKISHVALEDQRLQIRANRLPALDTWLVQFKSNAHPGNVSMRFGPCEGSAGRKERAWPSYVKSERLTQTLGEESNRPALTPSWQLCFWSIVTLILVYLFPLFANQNEYVPLSHLFTPPEWIDLAAVVALTLLSLVVFRISRIKPYPVIQGYLYHMDLSSQRNPGSQEVRVVATPATTSSQVSETAEQT